MAAGDNPDVGAGHVPHAPAFNQGQGREPVLTPAAGTGNLPDASASRPRGPMR